MSDDKIYARYRELRKTGLPALRAWNRAHDYEDGSAYCWRLEREAARIAAWHAAHPIIRIGKTPGVQFTMAELKAWKVDRATGYLKIAARKRPTLTPAKRLSAVLNAVEAYGPPELVARVRALAA